ncbi:MAG: AI-2E family transporter, partial [Alphaproteobacteria bacterium]
MPMEDPYEGLRTRLSHDLMQVALRALLIVLVLWICAKLFLPFAPLLVWALILAVTLYPLHQRLMVKVGGRSRLSGIILAALGLVVWGLPTVMLGISLVDHLGSSLAAWRAGGGTIPPPDPAVRDWPVVGSALHDYWLGLSENLQETLRAHSDTVRTALSRLVNGTGGVIMTVFTFIGALLIAVVIMIYGAQGSDAARRISIALVGSERGTNLQHLAVLTIRSVAAGVIGVAFVQALLLGLGFLWADVPFAGVWALVALV